MDPQLLALVFLFCGLVAGGVLGWFVASRPLAELRERLLIRVLRLSRQMGIKKLEKMRKAA